MQESLDSGSDEAETVYALDANVFIQAARLYYGFDLCPGFWRAVEHLHLQGRLESIDRIKAELLVGNDDLRDWAHSIAPRSFFASTDEPSVIDCFRELMKWVYSQQQLQQRAKDAFADGVDAWSIAYAKACGRSLVTHEGRASDAKNRVPIPNVCEAFGVPYLNTFEMLRELDVQFVCMARHAGGDVRPSPSPWPEGDSLMLEALRFRGWNARSEPSFASSGRKSKGARTR